MINNHPMTIHFPCVSGGQRREWFHIFLTGEDSLPNNLPLGENLSIRNGEYHWISAEW